MRLSARMTLIGLFLLAARSQATIVINNGLAPPSPANVINTVINESVFVEDSTSGAPTTVELVDGGQIGDEAWDRFEVFDSSRIIMSAGFVYDDIFSYGTSSVIMTGGWIQSSIMSYGFSTVTVSGGPITGGGLNATGSSTMTVIGRDFAVDGVPVPLGALEAGSGTLTGLYNDGQPFSVYFRQNLDSFYSGTITLVPEPTTALLLACGIGARRRPPH